MKYLYNSLLFCFIIFISFTAKSQTDIVPKKIINPAFGVNGGDIYAENIAITNDDYTYTAGMFQNTVDFDFTADTFNLSSTYGYNMFISKYDKQSHLVFAFKLSGISGYDDITGIATDKEDNIYVVGFFGETIDFDPGPGTAILSTPNYYTDYMFIAKYDKNGNYIFAKPLITNQDINHLPQINFIKADNNENVFIAGYGKPQNVDFDPGIGVAHPESHGKNDAFFAKYDASGNYIFSKAVGSNLDDECSGIAINKNNDIIIVGSFASSTNDFDPNKGKVSLFYKGGIDAFIGIYDSFGNYKYAFSFGGVKDDYVSDVVTENDSNIVVVGSFYGNVDFAPDSSIVKRTSDTDQDYFLAKYSSTAELLFVTAIHADSPTGSSLAVDSSNNIYITSQFNKSVVFTSTDSLVCTSGYDAFWAKYNSKGIYNFSSQQVTHKMFPSFVTVALRNNQIFVSSYFDSIAYFGSKKLTTQDLNYYIATYNTSTGNNTSANAYGTYRKFNVESTIVKMAHDSAGNTYVAGNFQGLIDFDPGIGVYYLESYQDASTRTINSLLYDDMFFAKYDTKGNLVFAKAITATGGVAATSIMVDNNHNIYVTGKYYGDMDADPGQDSAILHANPNTSLYRSCFINKYDSLGNYVFAKPLYISGELNASVLDKRNNVYITGYFGFGYFDPDNDTSRISVDGDYAYFAKYNSAGKFLYLKSAGQKNKNTFSENIVVNSKGNIAMSGNFNGSMVDFDPGTQTHYANSGSGYAHFVAAYSSAGNFLFEDNSSCITSNSNSETMFLTVDRNDNLIAGGPLSGTVFFNSVHDTLYSTQSGIAKAFLIKYNSRGTPLFLKTISEYNNNIGFSSLFIRTATTDDKNNIYLSSSFDGKIDFDLSDDTAFVYADTSMHSPTNIYLAKYDSAANYLYAYNFAAKDSFFNRSAETPDVFVNKNFDITWAVNANGKIDFYPGPDTLFYYPPFEGYPTFIYNYSFCLVKFKQTQTAKPFNIYALSPFDKIKTYNLNQYRHIR